MDTNYTALPRGHPPRIVLEGGVCSGKSTVGRLLADELGVPYVPEYVDWRDARGQSLPEGTPLERLSGYLATEEERAQWLADLEGGAVVDRSVLSLAAFEYDALKRGRPTVFDRVASALRGAGHIRPTALVVLDCDDTIRTARWTARGIPTGHFDAPEFNRNVRDFFQRIAGVLPLLRVDTTERNARQSVEAILSYLTSQPSTAAFNLRGAVDAIAAA